MVTRQVSHHSGRNQAHGVEFRVQSPVRALRTRDGSQSLTWTQYNERVRSVAAGLAALGVTRGDTVALMLSNRPEFQIVDSAAMHLGATPFSIYNTYPAEQAAHLLTNSASKVVVAK